MPTEEQLLLGYFLELFPQCKSSKTSCEEGKGKVSVRPDEGEDVHFFNFNKENHAVACLALKIPPNPIKKGERIICDCLVYFGKRSLKRDVYVESFCLVELKGSDLKHAMQQLINTFDRLKDLLLESPCKGQLQLIIKKGYIYKHGSAPKEAKDKDFVALRKKLADRFDDFAHLRNSDIGPFLRSNCIAISDLAFPSHSRYTLYRACLLATCCTIRQATPAIPLQALSRLRHINNITDPAI